jgi:hypothetical protein
MVSMDYGLNGSPKLDGPNGSWVSGINPVTHKYFSFHIVTVTVIRASCCLC